MRNYQVVRAYAVAFMMVTAPVAYHSFTEPMPTPKPPTQTVLYQGVPTAIDGPPPSAASVDEGDPLAFIRIPKFGAEWTWVVSSGTDMDNLNNGPGHFPHSALPGEDGNTAIAAHRAGYGDPFIDFDLLEDGDRVFLAQNGAEWEYEIEGNPEIIEPDEVWVVDDFAPGSWLTLVTCWPKYGAEKRMYVRASLVAAETTDKG